MHRSLFCTNTNVTSKDWVDISIFEKCYHNIIFGKTDVRLPLPPNYVCEVWDYSKANAENIKKQYLISIRQKAFENHSIGPKVEPLNETSLNIFGNYIPNKKIMGAYCQSPCMNDNTKGS